MTWRLPGYCSCLTVCRSVGLFEWLCEWSLHSLQTHKAPYSTVEERGDTCATWTQNDVGAKLPSSLSWWSC